MCFFQTAIGVLNSIIIAFQPGKSEKWPSYARKGGNQMNFVQTAIGAVRSSRRKYIRRLLVPPWL